MDNPLLSHCVTPSSSVSFYALQLGPSLLFSWALLPNTWQCECSASPGYITRVQEMTPKPLIPIQHTYIGTVFHMNYIPQCFTRKDKEPCALEMQWGPAGSAKGHSSRTVSPGLMDEDQTYMGSGSVMNTWS